MKQYNNKTMPQFLIIGGGIGGLTAAIALQQAGFSVKVLEAASEILPVGAGIALAGNAMKAFAELGIDKVIAEAGREMNVMQIRSQYGKVLSNMDMQKVKNTYGFTACMIHRSALHSVLLAQLASDTLVLGKKCRGFEQNGDAVTAHFEDGSSQSAHFLIGADGIKSVIRKQLQPHAKLRYSGYTCWRGVCNFEDVDFDRNLMSESWGWGERFGVCPLQGQQVYWFMVKNAPYKDPLMSAYGRTLMGDIFSHWHYPIPQLIEATAETDIVWHDLTDLTPLKSWGQGNVTLLGDAAHAMTPNMGQGACQAIEDGVFLANCVKKYGLTAAALRQYEQLRIPRTTTITKRSWQFGKIGQIENPIITPFRNLFIKLAARNPSPKQLKPIYGIDFQAV